VRRKAAPREADDTAPAVQFRVNDLDTSKPVPVLYFYRAPARTITDMVLMRYREIFGWEL
jgi:hypothetical protein